MAIALRSSSLVTYGTRTNTTVSAPAGAVSGSDVIVIALDVGGPAAVTVTPPSGWATIGPAHYQASDPWHVELYLFARVHDGASSWTFPHTSGSSNAWAGAYSGVDVTTPQDAAGTTNTATYPNPSDGLTAVFLGVTTATAGALLVGARGSWDGNAITPPTGWTERLDQPVLWVGETLVAAAGPTGNVNVTAGNAGNSSPWGTCLMALRPAGGGGGGANTATLAATLPRITSSIAGTQTNRGGLSAVIPRVQAAVPGSQTNSGSVSGTLPKLTAQIVGALSNPAGISAALPAVVSAIVGTLTNPGSISSSLPILMADIHGESTNLGVLAGRAPLLTAFLVGTQINPAELDATLPLLVAHLAEVGSANVAVLNAALPLLRASITGVSVNPASINATLTPMTASLVGTLTNRAVLDSVLPSLAADLTVEQINAAVLDAAFSLLQLSITDIVTVLRNLTVIAALLPARREAEILPSPRTAQILPSRWTARVETT